jgi:putative acetyltransferase
MREELTGQVQSSLLILYAASNRRRGVRRQPRDEAAAQVCIRSSPSAILRPMPVIKPGDFGDDRLKALLVRHLEGMHASSPPGHVFALDWSGLQKPEISFYALWEGEELLGFGALKELEPRAGEIKSMRTTDAHLRRGVAATILDHIIAEARRRGYTRLSLETGSGPAFEPALELYRKYGFIEGGAFGDYEKSPFNQFLHLELASTQVAQR